MRQGYSLTPGVASLFRQPIVVVNQAALGRSPWHEVRTDATKMINALGVGSAIAQGLVGRGGPSPITEVHRLGETDARVYLLAQQDVHGPLLAVGLLKVGKKNLFHFDANGRTRELREQMCVLDFYVHEDWQRGGLGRALFEAMLQNEGVDASKLAYDVRDANHIAAELDCHLDALRTCASCEPFGMLSVRGLHVWQRPSPKLIGFMRKHYGLTNYVPQQNKFVIFDEYFADKPMCEPSHAFILRVSASCCRP